MSDLVTIHITMTAGQLASLLRLAENLQFYLSKKIKPKARRAPRKFSELDSWIDIVAAVDESRERITSAELIDSVLMLERKHGRIPAISAARLAHAMRLNGWNGPKVLWVDGKVQRGYERSIPPK